MEGENFIRKRDAFFVGMRNLCLTDSVAGVCGGCVESTMEKKVTHYSENGTADCRSRVLRYDTCRTKVVFFLCVWAAKH